MKSIQFGKPDSGTPFTIVFLYSKKGNFVLKGNIDKIQYFIKNEHPRSFYRVSCYKKGMKSWGYWRSPCLSIEREWKTIPINKPYMFCPRSTIHYDKKYTIVAHNPNAERGKWHGTTEIKLKRIPNKWIPEFDKLVDEHNPSI